MCSDRLVPARREPSSRSPVRGAGARAAGGTRPRLSALGRLPDPGLPRAAAGFYPCALGSDAGRGDGSRPCAPSLLREPAPRLRAGAGWARGGGHAARERTTAQPIGAAAAAHSAVLPPPPSPPALPRRGRGAREGRRATWRLGLGFCGRRCAHPLPPSASVCPIQNQVVVGWWGLGGHAQSERERLRP